LTAVHRDLVLDIGCGHVPSRPRPFAPHASYIGIDPEMNELFGRGSNEPVVCADGCQLPFAGATVDWVVARNVFGDVGLGHRVEDVTGGHGPGEYAVHLSRLQKRGATAELALLAERMRRFSEQIDRKKRELLSEIGRVLHPGAGGLVVVETLTPRFAETFFRSLVGSPRSKTEKNPRLDIKNVSWTYAEIRNYSQRARHCWPEELESPGLLVWRFVVVESRTGEQGNGRFRP
jgi:SAM-dependent methyltransferase